MLIGGRKANLLSEVRYSEMAGRSLNGNNGVVCRTTSSGLVQMSALGIRVLKADMSGLSSIPNTLCHQRRNPIIGLAPIVACLPQILLSEDVAAGNWTLHSGEGCSGSY